jgi:predicted nuclease with TOPRIM domain
MEVAMGFKLIYSTLMGRDPPGLQLGELQKASDFVSHRITVGDIDRIKNGIDPHQDVQDVLDEIVKVKGVESDAIKFASEETNKLRKTNEDIKKTIDNLTKNWDKQMTIRDARGIIQIKSMTRALRKEVETLKKQNSEDEIKSTQQVQYMEARMDAANEALQKAEKQNADLIAASEMSVRLSRIEGALTASLSRLETSDGKLVEHIKNLIPLDPSGNPINPAAQFFKDLLPTEVTTTNSAVILQGQAVRITSLEESGKLLEESNEKLKESLLEKQARVAELTPLIGELSAEKEKAEKLTADNEQLKKSFVDLQGIIIHVLKFYPVKNIENNEFDANTITDNFTYIANVAMPTGITKNNETTIKRFMKLSYTLMVHYSAYQTVKKKPESLNTSSIVFKNITKIVDVLKDDFTKNAFMQLSAASHGFSSLQQASDCLTDAVNQISFNQNQACFYKETSVGTSSESNYIFEIQSRADKSTPFAVQLIDFATKKLSLFSSTMAFAVRWMGESKSDETKLRIVKLLVDATNTLGLNVRDVAAISSIEILNKFNFNEAVKLWPPLLIGQILSNKTQADSVVNISSGKTSKIGECYEAAQKLIKHVTDPKQTPPIKFDAKDVELLKLLHVNENIIPKPS